MRRLLCLLGLVLAAAAFGACGSDDEQEAPAQGDDAADTRLRVEVTGASAQPIQMQLVCDGECDVAALRKIVADAGTAERACTLQYGGPEKATVTGTVEGEKVDLQLDRADGCGIADYEALFAAFGREAPIARG